VKLRFLFWLALAIGTLLLSGSVRAQDLPEFEIGLKPFGTYHGGSIDSVSITNGNLTIDMPLFSYPQRGGKLKKSLDMIYNNKGWKYVTTCNHITGECTTRVTWRFGGISIGDPEDVTGVGMSCSFTTGGNTALLNVIWTDLGASHVVWPTSLSNWMSFDGSGLSQDHTTGMVTHRDGTRVFGIYTSSVLDREDPNGNQINIDGTDTLGRLISSNDVASDTVGCPVGQRTVIGAYIISVPGPGGTSSQIKYCIASVPIATNFGFVDTQYIANAAMIQSILLYNGSSWSNSQAWTFEYDSRDPGDPSSINYGDLTKITFPTGGTISYTWAMMVNSTQESRVLTSRTVNANDGTGPHTWTYTPVGGTGGTNVVTDPLGNDTVYTVTNIGNGQSGYVTKVQYYQGSQATGTLLKTEATDYTYTAVNSLNCTGIPNSPAVFQVQPIRVTTTWPGGKVSKVETDYDTNSFTFTDSIYGTTYPGSYGQVLAVRHYDYGSGTPGPLVSQTVNTYLSSSNSSYLTYNMLDLLSSVSVKDGAGVLRAYTTYGYDESSLQSSSISTQRNPSPMNGNVRGNRTSVHRWVNTNGTYLVSSSTFFDTGTVKIATDPKGNSTTFDYSSAYAGAYPTTVTNALSQSTTNVYDFNTGLLNSSTDPNSQTTSHTYDALFRLTQSSLPDGGSTAFSYQDASAPFSVTVTKTITPTLNLLAKALVDGVGRVSQAQLLSDPGGNDYINSTYDAVGHKATVSNPYRSANDPTYGITTSQYDGLGRVTKLIPPDGTTSTNNVNTVYSDNCTTVTDQAGKIRKSCTDGLGRLIEVDEPTLVPATPGTGSATVSGSEKSAGGSPATSGTGSVTITGIEKSKRDLSCDPGLTCPKIYDFGTVSITVNGFTKGVGYGYNSTNLTIASALTNAFNADGASPVTASVASNVVYLTAKATGASSNYPLSASYTYDSSDFTSGSFIPACSGSTLTGGANATSPTYDTGTVWVTVNGFQASASYGQSSTASSLASALVNVFNTNTASPVTGSLSGSQVILTAKLTGAASNYALSAGSSTSQPGTFGTPSFAVSVSGSTLTGGTDQGSSFATPMVTLYAYDTLGNLLRVDQKGNDANSAHWRTRTFTYNSLSQLLTANNPESGTISYAYDADGNMLTKTDARSITTTYAYDALNRLTGKTYSNGDPAVSYTYDQPSCLGQAACFNIGRRTSMTDAGGSQAWAYDKMGRPIIDRRTTNSVTKSTLYTYNLDGSIATITYPSGRTITYTSSAVSRPLSAVDSANAINYATGATYAPQGALSSLTNAGMIVSTMYYNNRLQPCRISMKSSGTAPTACSDSVNVGNVMDLTYNFNLGTADNGNVTGIANNRDTTRSQTFTYDALNRLATARTTSTYATSPAHCWGEAFNYDQWANMLSIGAVSSAYIGCTQENLNIATTTKNQISGNTYDTAGNTTADGVNSYVWNAESQIKTAAGVNYTYDGDGNRVQKSNGKIYWYGAGTEILDETDLAGNVTNEYIYFGGRRVARRDSGGNIYYYMEDFLGSSRVITTAAGSVCYDADFYPFGGERAYTNTCPQSYKFEGKERDAETGNDDFGARYYSSSTGRWLSADWSAIPAPVPYANFTNPQTLNLYAMVRDNPETFADLDGHQTLAGAERDATINMADSGGISIGGDSSPLNPESVTQYQQEQSQAQNQQGPAYQKPKNGQEAKLANVVYNETSSLRPNPSSKPGDGGSAEALRDAREGIAEVAQRAFDSGHPERVAPSDLSDKDRRALNAGNADAIRAHNDALAAAREALAGANNTNGDTQYRLRSPGVSRDRPINGKDTNFAYGPFINTLGRRQTIVFAP
jgi:RHS repeat-associated protein